MCLASAQFNASWNKEVNEDTFNFQVEIQIHLSICYF